MNGAPTSKNGQDRLAKLLEAQGGMCAICGLPATVQNSNVDHREPKAKGGPSYSWNLQAAHVVCNAEKGSKKRPNKKELRRAMAILRNAPLNFSSSQINSAVRKKPR